MDNTQGDDPYSIEVSFEGAAKYWLAHRYDQAANRGVCSNQSHSRGICDRVVELHGGNNLLVIAYSFFPESTILEYPWLKSLGMHPLGKALHSRGYISRSDFEFARTHWIYTNHDGSTSSTDTWARKYRFLLEPGDIELIELLCPQFLFEVGRQC